MAFHSTSERYEYIYGNNARDLKESRPETVKAAAVPKKKTTGTRAPSDRPRPKKERKNTSAGSTARVRENQARFLAFDWKYTVVVITAVLCCAAGAMFYVHGTAQLHVLENQVSDLKTEKTTLLGEQSALQSEIDKSINLEEIGKYAEKKLHMVYPDQSKIIHYKGESDDYFRQYESIDADQ